MKPQPACPVDLLSIKISAKVSHSNSFLSSIVREGIPFSLAIISTHIRSFTLIINNVKGLGNEVYHKMQAYI